LTVKVRETIVYLLAHLINRGVLLNLSLAAGTLQLLDNLIFFHEGFTTFTHAGTLVLFHGWGRFLLFSSDRLGWWWCFNLLL